MKYRAKLDMPGYKKGILYEFEDLKYYIDAFEEVKDTIIHPGVVKMYNDYEKSTFSSIHKHTYEEWYETFNAMGYKPFTILVDGVEWSVGDWYSHDHRNNFQIKSFEWIPTYRNIDGWWKIGTTDGKNCNLTMNVVQLSIFKGKSPKPICQLPDENGKMVDIYPGIYWYVNQRTWVIDFDTIGEADELNDGICKPFATKAAAKKYVKDNKPVYPAGLVEPLFFHFGSQEYSYRIDNLKSFRDNLEKK